MDTRTSNDKRQKTMTIAQNVRQRAFSTSTPAFNGAISVGSLRFANLANGLYLHSCDHVISETLTNTVELEPGLSFNLLMEGTLDFSVGANRYQFEAEGEKPVLLCSVLSSKDVFTRFLTSEQRVKKVNVAVHKEWLFSRVCNNEDRNWLGQIFSKSGVFTLPHNENTRMIAEDILALSDNTSMSKALTSETFATQMFMNCLELLQHNFKSLVPLGSVMQYQGTKLDCEIAAFIAQNLKSRLTVQSIASELGLSSSTLQRRFQHRHQQSVNKYIKCRRLEQAKNELLIDNLSIGEVAFNAGYNHVSNFNHAFSKFYGMSPARYIKNHFTEN